MLGNLFANKKSHPPASAPTDTPPVAATPPAQPNQPQAPQAVAPVDATPDMTAESTLNPSVRQDLSVLTHLDARTTAVLHQAEQETKRIKQQEIQPEQILFGLLFDQEIFQMLQGMGADSGKLSHDLQTQEKEGTYVGQPTFHADTKALFEKAFREANTRGVTFIAPEDLLQGLYTIPAIAALLEAQGAKKEKLTEVLSKSSNYTAAKKSIIEKYGIDLTEEARSGKLDPIAGRDKEIDRMAHILLRRTKNNPIIIGEAGTGKTAIVEGLAQSIANGTVPKDLAGKRIIQLDLAALVAGASHRGEFEERLKGVITEAIASAGKTLLFIDEIHTLMGAGGEEGSLDASNIIKPHLARGQMQIIGTTTTSEYRKYFEKDKAFARRFQPILCDEPSEEVAVEMMKILKAKYEKFHSVVIPDEALVVAVKLSKKYIGERYLPDKAVDLIDEAAADVKLQQSLGKSKNNTVTKTQIEQVVSSWTGIPITKLTEDESAKLLKLEDRIHQRLIDQEEAVVAVSEAVRRGRIGLASANRPIASFIFLGPSGTGKTELAKTLAEILFGKDDAMVRLDMSEYMEKHEVAKLIGAPPGYVGYEEGGQLTEAVRAKPYSIVLLDEVEKAHPDVFNILLQLLEDGRLTDNKGNTISFKNTIVICTSNIGSAAIQQKLGEQQNGQPLTPELEAKNFEELSGLVTGELRKFFRPELLNRFDDIVIFKPLRRQDMAAITKLGLAKTQKLLEEQNIKIAATDAAINQLSMEGYDPLYGARPLRRLIQTAIENSIAVKIIGKEFVAGDVIKIDYDPAKGEFSFVKGVAAPEGVEKNGQKGDGQVLPSSGQAKTDAPDAAAQPGQSSGTAQQSTTPNGQVQPTLPSSGQATPPQPVTAPEPVMPTPPPAPQAATPTTAGGAQPQPV